MRIIKFRAWDKRNNIMLDNVGFQHTDVGLLIKPQVGMVFMGTEDERRTHYEGRYGTDHILLQFTGLKDKNGKEIYEGDIVQSPTGKAEIKFSSGSFYWKDVENEMIYAALSSPDSFRADNDFEVIGNIYENPELLESVTGGHKRKDIPKI